MSRSTVLDNVLGRAIARPFAPPARSGLRLIGSAALSFGLFASLGSCTDIAYFDGFETLTIDANTPESEHPQFAFWVQTTYDLDFAPPVTADEIDSVGTDADAISERDPWLEADDMEMALAWSLTNDTDQDMTAWVMLDGANEFFDWDAVSMYGMAGGEDADEIAFPTLLGFTPLELGAGETMRGEFREDDIREAMFDLDVLTRFCGSAFSLLYNRHEVAPIGTEYVPDDAIIAGFYRVRLTLGADGPAHLDYGIRVRDRQEVLFDANATEYSERFEAEPELFTPTGFAPPVDGMDPGTASDYCLAVNPPPPPDP